MTYGLPDTGDLNWGGPVNNSVEALHALAQAAAADALAARNDAAYAKNLVDGAGDLSTAVSDAEAAAALAVAKADDATTSESGATTAAAAAATKAGEAAASALTAQNNANGFDIGTTTTGAAGAAALATITGTAPSRRLNLTIPTGATGAAGAQGTPGPGAAAWTAAQAVVVGSVRQAPDGSWIKSTTARTTRASFDATEQTFWATTGSTASTLEQVALMAAFGYVNGRISAPALKQKIRPVWQYTFRVGPTRTLTTIAAAVTEARKTPYAHVGQAPGPGIGDVARARGGRPAFARCLILLDAGTSGSPITYSLSSSLLLGDGIDIAGDTTDRSTVVIDCASSAVNYNLQAYGSLYAANLTLNHNNGNGNNYPFHGSSSPTEASATVVFENVYFLDTFATSFGIVGWDMEAGTTAVFYKCKLESTTGHNSIIHSMTNKDTTTLFIETQFDCTGTNPLTGSDTGTYAEINCTHLDGTARTNVSIQDGVTNAPLSVPLAIAGGMSERERAEFHPTRIFGPSAVITPYVPDRVSVTLTAARTYYIPLPPAPASYLLDKLRATIISAAGTVSMGLYYGSGDVPTNPLNWSAAITAVNGDMDFARQATYATLFVPRTWKLWLGFRASSASCALYGSTTLAGIIDCYYKDGESGAAVPLFPATPTKVPAGDSVPWVALTTLAG